MSSREMGAGLTLSNASCRSLSLIFVGKSRRSLTKRSDSLLFGA